MARVRCRLRAGACLAQGRRPSNARIGRLLRSRPSAQRGPRAQGTPTQGVPCARTRPSLASNSGPRPWAKHAQERFAARRGNGQASVCRKDRPWRSARQSASQSIASHPRLHGLLRLGATSGSKLRAAVWVAADFAREGEVGTRRGRALGWRVPGAWAPPDWSAAGRRERLRPTPTPPHATSHKKSAIEE